MRIALFDFRQTVDYRLEILSGLTVAMALIPEAVAFALIAGLSPLTGLYAAFVVGLVASVIGGRPGMISGATGAVAVVIAALVFAWDNAIRIRARKRVDDKGWKHYEIYGPLFFGSTTVFAEKFDVAGDPEHVVIDFAESRVVDMSAIEALNRLTSRYEEAGKTVHLRHLSKDCCRLMDKADYLIEVNHFEDPTYKVLTDQT